MTVLLREALRLALPDSKRHLRFPFVCHPGAAGLRVEWRFGPPGGGGVRSLINLSVSGAGGFRGAGHRHGTVHEAVLGEHSATPGFLPGPITPGAWEVTLHTHLVADETHGELVVTALDAPPPPPAPAHPLTPPGRHALDGWMMGDLHCHSNHSDARWTVPELAQAATARGLDFLALTDHNTTSGRATLREVAPHLLQLPGVELTTFYGHAVALGVEDMPDWTGPELDRGMVELASGVKQSGGVFTLAHPFAPGDPLCTGCTWTYFDLRPEHASHLEVWNGPWEGAHNARALAYWYALLARGHRVIATAGTDAHGPAYDPGHGFTFTPRERDGEALLAGLRAGRTYLSRGARLDLEVHTPAGPAPLGGVAPAGWWEADVRWSGVPGGGTLVWIADGSREEAAIADEGQLRWAGEVRHWLNLELRGRDGELHTLGNPVFAEVEPAGQARARGPRPGARRTRGSRAALAPVLP